MEFSQILESAIALIGEGRPALFTTLGEGGYPHSRWMTPALLPRIKGTIFAVTSRGFPKVAEVEADPRVQWMIQAADFSLVATLLGKASVVDDPAFCAEVIKAIGPNLGVFWRLNKDSSSLRVIETVIESASILYPLRAERFSARSPHE